MIFEGTQFPSVMHAFAAARVGDGHLYKRIQTADLPEVLEILETTPARKNWDFLALPTMYLLLRDKFIRSTKGRNELIASTAFGETFELTGTDPKWTLGPDGQGENRLGKLLNVIREQFCQGQWVGGEAPHP